MFEFIPESLLSADFFNGVAVTLTILTASYSAWNFYRRLEKGLRIGAARTIILKDENINGIEVEAKSDLGVSKALFRDVFVVSNRSESALSDMDFSGAPFKIKKENGIVHGARKISIIDSGDFRILSSDNCLEVRNLELPAQYAIAFEVYHDGCVEAQISTAPRLSYKTRRWAPDTEYLYPLNFALLVLVFALGALFYMPVADYLIDQISRVTPGITGVNRLLKIFVGFTAVLTILAPMMLLSFFAFLKSIAWTNNRTNAERELRRFYGASVASQTERKAIQLEEALSLATSSDERHTRKDDKVPRS